MAVVASSSVIHDPPRIWLRRRAEVPGRPFLMLTGKSGVAGRAAVIAGLLVAAVLIVDVVAFALGIRRLGYGAERFYQSSALLGWEYRPSTEGYWYPFKDGTRTYVRVNS